MVFEFVGLTFGLSLPFWVLGAVEGGTFGSLPIASAMVVCPAGAASIVVSRRDGRRGVRRLWRRLLDRSVQAKWAWLVAIGAVPASVVATAAVEQFTGDATAGASTPWAWIVPTLVLFGVAAVFEEVGWSGLAVDAMQRRLTPVITGLVLGMVWAVWHYVPLLQADRSMGWIAWWTLFTVAFRVILVLAYNGAGGSVPVTVVGHAAGNVATVTFGDFFTPSITGVVLAVLAAALVVVLARRETASPSARPVGN